MKLDAWAEKIVLFDRDVVPSSHPGVHPPHEQGCKPRIEQTLWREQQAITKDKSKYLNEVNFFDRFMIRISTINKIHLIRRILQTVLNFECEPEHPD